MKLSKKLISIVLIFVILQLVGAVFVNNVSYADDTFLGNISDRGKAWSQMGESESQGIIDNATGITGAITSISSVIRIICIAIFLVRIAITAVKLSSDDSPNHKAIAKGEVVFLAVLAIIFIFAEKIITGLIGFFEQLQGIE